MNLLRRFADDSCQWELTPSQKHKLISMLLSLIISSQHTRSTTYSIYNILHTHQDMDTKPLLVDQYNSVKKHLLGQTYFLYQCYSPFRYRLFKNIRMMGQCQIEASIYSLKQTRYQNELNFLFHLQIIPQANPSRQYKLIFTFHDLQHIDPSLEGLLRQGIKFSVISRLILSVIKLVVIEKKNNYSCVNISHCSEPSKPQRVPSVQISERVQQSTYLDPAQIVKLTSRSSGVQRLDPNTRPSGDNSSKNKRTLQQAQMDSYYASLKIRQKEWFKYVLNKKVYKNLFVTHDLQDKQ